MTTRAEYQQFIEQAYQLEKDRGPEEYENALRHIQSVTPLFGYSAPRWNLDFGAACAFLYARTGDPAMAEQAKQSFFFYRDWRQNLPPEAYRMRPEYADGIPPLDMMFHPVIFVPALQNLRPALSPVELETFTGLLAESLQPIWRFPEWGGHNRAILRAASLAVSAAAFPDHPHAARWTAMADELAEESWGRWSIEDAMLYQSHWMRALILYAEARGREAELKDMIQPRMHMKAMTQLISPLGILPDFGDSHWLMHSQWEWAACLEWGADAYGDPSMKWAAERLFEARRGDTPTVYLAQAAALNWRWCADGAPSHPPLNPSDALDDLVIKKLVWRTGWEEDATYACLNYRDEGDYGRAARDFLRTSLAVSAEKMHHGHSDEGSFVMLAHQGTLLLHESGYRESPPDGIYRSPVYHNRVVWQPGRQPREQGLLEFLRGDGRYQPVRTERLYQTQLGDAQISRVRVTDETQGLAWDRSIFFLPDLPCWVVIDAVQARREALRTLGSLWWTTDILAQGENWFDTHLRGVVDWTNRRDAALLVCLPPVPGTSDSLSVTPFRRHFQQEIAMARTWYGEQRPGRCVNFVSVLWPHAINEDPAARAASIEVIPASRLAAELACAWRGVAKTAACANA
jgi:hypothetical protein